MICKFEYIVILFVISMMSCGTRLYQYEVCYQDKDGEILQEIILAFDELKRETRVKKLEYFKLFCVLPESRYQLSETILLNKARNKFCSVMYKKGSSYYTSDGIENIYGIKIKSKWYLIRASLLVLPRRYYQYDSYEPMTFEELSYLAHDMRHKHYMKKTDDGKYVADSDKIDKLITPRNLLGFYPDEPRTGDEAWINSIQSKNVGHPYYRRTNTIRKK